MVFLDGNIYSYLNKIWLWLRELLLWAFAPMNILFYFINCHQIIYCIDVRIRRKRSAVSREGLWSSLVTTDTAHPLS